MREKIQFGLIRYFPYGHGLAHGEANLYQPLRYPGRYSIVGGDYWENVKNYTRVERPPVPYTDGQSSSRTCQKCKEDAQQRTVLFIVVPFAEIGITRSVTYPEAIHAID